MSKRNQLDSNFITDLVAVVSQRTNFINSTLIDFSLSFNYTILQFLSCDVVSNITNFRILYIYFFNLGEILYWVNKVLFFTNEASRDPIFSQIKCPN